MRYQKTLLAFILAGILLILPSHVALQGSTDDLITETLDLTTSISTHSLCQTTQYTIQQHIEFSLTDDSYQYLTVEDSTPYNRPGLPLLPMQTLTFNLPKEATMQSITLEDYHIQQLPFSLEHQITPTPQFWSINQTPLHLHTQEIIDQDITEAQQQDLYPGTTHTSIIGKNTTNTTLILHLFPLQYHFDTQDTYFISHGELIITYTLEEPQETPTTNTQSVQNIIITHPSFSTQAERLKEFHDNQGVTTEVVTTRWIKNNYEPSESPDIMGYKDFKLSEKLLKYDEKLALCIISYLQEQSTNPNLQFITLFGNGIHVPPSYYFGYTYYPVPTDFYYASPDLDLIPNYRIGRLPVNTLLEAKRTVDKIIEWNPTTEQMDNVAIAGGIPFSSAFYIGELITIYSANQGYLDGLNITKLFRSEERFESDDILDALQDEYGLIYMICHGNSDCVVVEEGRITAKTLARQAENNNAPILSCIACSTGSYDTHIIRQGYDLDRTSAGEAFVVSKGGAIAYIGGSRTNDGFPLLTLQNGSVQTTKETYMAGLLTSVNDAYQQNAEYLGDLCFYASEEYLKNNDMEDFWNQYHYLDFILLGDPALQLPQREYSHDTYENPEVSTEETPDYIPFDSDGYNGTFLLSAINETTTYRVQTNSPTITLKQIETGNYETPEVQHSNHTTQQGNATISLTTTAGEIQLLRFETADGKEEWIYYQPARIIDDDYTTSTPGFGVTRWNTIQAALDISNDGDCLYVFNGLYNESIELTSPCSLQGENAEKTIIDGQGNEDVVLITTDDITLEGFTIRHCGKDLDNAGIKIQPKNSWNPDTITIQDNIITHNKNCGIYIDAPSRYFDPDIQITSNLICDNHFGIYAYDTNRRNTYSSNTFIDNTYGFYLITSYRDIIADNSIEDNSVGLFFDDSSGSKVFQNSFINNTQDCQFHKNVQVRFYENYWDTWMGRHFNIALPIPKLINGKYESSQSLLTHIDFDFKPVNEPYE